MSLPVDFGSNDEVAGLMLASPEQQRRPFPAAVDQPWESQASHAPVCSGRFDTNDH